MLAELVQGSLLDLPDPQGRDANAAADLLARGAPRWIGALFQAPAGGIVQTEPAADQPGLEGGQTIQRRMQELRLFGLLQLEVGTMLVGNRLLERPLPAILALRRERLLVDHRLDQGAQPLRRDPHAGSDLGRVDIMRVAVRGGAELVDHFSVPALQPEQAVGHADQREVVGDGPLDRLHDPERRV